MGGGAVRVGGSGSADERKLSQPLGAITVLGVTDGPMWATPEQVVRIAGRPVCSAGRSRGCWSSPRRDLLAGEPQHDAAFRQHAGNFDAPSVTLSRYVHSAGKAGKEEPRSPGMVPIPPVWLGNSRYAERSRSAQIWVLTLNSADARSWARVVRCFNDDHAA